MRMIKIGTILITAILLCFATAFAEPTVVILEKSKIWIEGDSTLHKYESKATRINANLALESATAHAGWKTIIIEKKLSHLQIGIPVKSMKSDKKGLDSNMYKAMDADKYPAILFELKKFDGVSLGKDALQYQINASGDLSISGTTRGVELQAKAEEVGQQLIISGNKKLNMTSFGIKPPSVFLGTIKTDDEVTIHYEIYLQLMAEQTNSSTIPMKGADNE